MNRKLLAALLLSMPLVGFLGCASEESNTAGTGTTTTTPAPTEPAGDAGTEKPAENP